MSALTSLFSKNLIGLDIGVSGIKAVQMEGRKNFRLSAYNRVPLPWGAIESDGEVKQVDAVIQAIRSLFEGGVFSTKRVAIGASGKSVMTKKIVVPRMSAKELNNTLYFEAEQYVPFNMDDINFDYTVIGPAPGTQSEPAMEVLIVAAKKDYIGTLTSMVESAGLSPELVDLESFALGNAFEFNYGYLQGNRDSGASMVLDFGAGSTKLCLVEGNKTTFSRELRGGGNSCTTLLAERLGIPYADAEKAKLLEPNRDPYRTLVAEHVHNLVEEVGRTVDLVLGGSADKSLQGVYICGGASKTLGLKEGLERRLPAPVQLLNPVQNIAGSGAKLRVQAVKELSYLGAVAVGLALRRPGDRK